MELYSALARVGSRAADVSGAANGSFGPDVGARSPSALTLARASRAGPPGWAESPEGFAVWCWFGEESVDAGLEVDDRAQHAAFDDLTFANQRDHIGKRLAGKLHEPFEQSRRVLRRPR